MLVLLDDGPLRHVLWAEMNIDNLTQTRQLLANREKTALRQIGFFELIACTSIRCLANIWPTNGKSSGLITWAKRHQMHRRRVFLTMKRHPKKATPA